MEQLRTPHDALTPPTGPRALPNVREILQPPAATESGQHRYIGLTAAAATVETAHTVPDVTASQAVPSTDIA